MDVRTLPLYVWEHFSVVYEIKMYIFTTEADHFSSVYEIGMYDYANDMTS